MFHIHTLEGDHYDVTLEALLHRKEVKALNRKVPVRRIISGEKESEKSGSDAGIHSYAEKSYREALNLKSEREPLFHAYQIMSSPVKTLRPDMNVMDAWNYFKKSGVCHMPVLSEEGRITGIVSDRDLLKYLLIEDDKIINRTDAVISEIMVKEVITAERVTDIRRIAMVMFNEHIGTMPILDEGRKLAGIITRSDILHALISYPALKLWG